MSAPLFTILIPTFNRRDLVVHAINSVLKQTFDDFEIIVCDNFSTDDTCGSRSWFHRPANSLRANSRAFRRLCATGNSPGPKRPADSFFCSEMMTLWWTRRSSVLPMNSGVMTRTFSFANWRNTATPGSPAPGGIRCRARGFWELAA